MRVDMTSSMLSWRPSLTWSNTSRIAEKPVRDFCQGFCNLLISVALAHLCEFIEDCEFTKLSVRILHLLGLEGPKTHNPTKFIRYIYNRVVLENAVVRAAAVSSLAKFGVCVEDSKVMKSVNVLLRRCLDDVDDEVRDRAAMYIKVLEEKTLADHFIRDGRCMSLWLGSS